MSEESQGGVELLQRRSLKGHFGKVYDCHWAPDSEHVLSTAEDGKLLIWNALSTNKEQVFPLKSSWVMTCAYAPSGKFVASGGLDNMVSIFKVDLDDEEGIDKLGAIKELSEHDGYVSCIEFMSDECILSASGDHSCIQWDINSGNSVGTFRGHSADISSISLFDNDSGVFVSGSSDHSCALWDPRDPSKPVAIFTGHSKDVSDVCFFPSGNVFASSSHDQSCKLWDIRSCQAFKTLESKSSQATATCVDFSQSGKYLISGYENGDCLVWNVLTGQVEQTLKGHGDLVCSVEVSPNGTALCSGSWDSTLIIWA